MDDKDHEFVLRLLSDDRLREEFLRAPRETAAAAGVNVTDEELAALSSADWGDEELVARVSKSGNWRYAD